MTPKLRRLLIAVIAIAVITSVAGVIVVRSTRFQLAYHKWQMQRAWDETWARPEYEKDGIAGYRLGESHERYEYHRQRLINLGVVSELIFRFQYIRLQTDESRHFIKLLLTSCPTAIDWESPSPDEPEPLELTVWCYSQDAGPWNRFITARDVPDYAVQFIKDDGKSPATD